MPQIRDIITTIHKASDSKELAAQATRATLVAHDFETSTKVSGRPNYRWAKDYDNPSNMFQVYGPGVKDNPGLPVLISKVSRPPHYKRVIIGVDYNRLDSGSAFAGDLIDIHGSSHEWPENNPGDDLITIYPRAFAPLSLRRVSGLFVWIVPGLYRYKGQAVMFMGVTLDMATYKPSAGKACRVVLYLDPVTNTVTGLSSALVDAAITPSYILPPRNTLALAWVKLYSDTTVLTEAALNEPRAFLAIDEYTDTVLKSQIFG